MRIRRPHASSAALTDKTGSNNGISFLDEMASLSLLRINIEQITLAEESPMLEQLVENAARVTLEYKFPCTAGVSSLLATAVKIYDKEVTASSIEFRHKRVVQVKLNESVLPLWEKETLILTLNTNTAIGGKNVIRLLGKCRIPLSELVVSPFFISREFDFVGNEFIAQAMVRIDLGTRRKDLRDKLIALRNDHLNETSNVRERYVAGSHTRSRSASRQSRLGCRSCSSDPGSPTVPRYSRNNQLAREINEEKEVSSRKRTSDPEQTEARRSDFRQAVASVPFREKLPSNISDISSSVFERSTNSSQRNYPPTVPRLETLPSQQDKDSYSGKLTLSLTVHEAKNLPHILDDNGTARILPSTYVSVLGRDGVMTSSVSQNERNPRYNWTAQFLVSGERGNLVIKILHRGRYKEQSIGFVTLSRPFREIQKGSFELSGVVSDGASRSEVPEIVITLAVMEHRIVSPSEELPAQETEIMHSSPRPQVSKQRVLSSSSTIGSHSSRSEGSGRSGAVSGVKWINGNLYVNGRDRPISPPKYPGESADELWERTKRTAAEMERRVKQLGLRY